MGLGDDPAWRRTADGKIVLRLIEEWEAGVTAHGDIAMSFTTIIGNDPAIPAGQKRRSQFICTREDARTIAQTILRTLAFARTEKAADFEALRNRIRSPALAALMRHWMEARGKRRMPAWEDIQMSALAPHLGHIWAFDFDRATGSFTGRLAGSAIMLGFGKSFLGTPLRALHPPHVFEVAHANFLQVVTEPACFLWSGKLFRMDDQIVEGERLILPMGADPDKPYGLLGVSDYANYPLARTPGNVELMHDIADWCAL